MTSRLDTIAERMEDTTVIVTKLKQHEEQDPLSKITLVNSSVVVIKVVGSGAWE